jgi:hypothetical protein
VPREYRALVDQHVDRERRQDGRFGVVASVAANLMGGKQGGGQFQPADFFPSLSDRMVHRAAPATASDEQVLAGLTAWAALCGTKVR